MPIVPATVAASVDLAAVDICCNALLPCLSLAIWYSPRLRLPAAFTLRNPEILKCRSPRHDFDGSIDVNAALQPRGDASVFLSFHLRV